MSNNFKNPSAPATPNPKGLDAKINELQTALSGLSWLQKSFGRAKIIPTKLGGKKLLQPMVYQGEKDYYPVLPNDALNSYSFFRVWGNRANPEQSKFANAPIDVVTLDLIFWVNLEAIDNTKDYIYTEDLITEVRDLLKTQNVTVKTVSDEKTEDIFRGYTLNTDHRDLLMKPYQAWRIELEVSYSIDCNVFVPPPCPPPSDWDGLVAQLGRGYRFPSNFATTSYRDGDDAWQAQNIFTQAILDAEKLKAINTRLDLYTLANDNKFGNTNAFTDELGGQDYLNNYYIDHETGIGWYGVEQPALNWEDAIYAALGTDFTNGLNSTLGYTDWFMASLLESATINDPQNIGILNSIIIYSNSNKWISTTEQSLTTNASILGFRNTISRGNKSSSLPYIFCRKHF